jgi:3'-5' exoribonuclease
MLLGHIPIGLQMLHEYAGHLDEAHRLALLHCVLCHHGPSLAPGGRFATSEAMALYRLNAVDVGVSGALPSAPGAGGSTAAPSG